MPPSCSSPSSSYLHVPLEIPTAALRMRHTSPFLQLVALRSPNRSASRFASMIRFIGVVAPRSPPFLVYIIVSLRFYILCVWQWCERWTQLMCFCQVTLRLLCCWLRSLFFSRFPNCFDQRTDSTERESNRKHSLTTWKGQMRHRRALLFTAFVCIRETIPSRLRSAKTDCLLASHFTGSLCGVVARSSSHRLNLRNVTVWISPDAGVVERGTASSRHGDAQNSPPKRRKRRRRWPIRVPRVSGNIHLSDDHTVWTHVSIDSSPWTCSLERFDVNPV